MRKLSDGLVYMLDGWRLVLRYMLTPPWKKVDIEYYLFSKYTPKYTHILYWISGWLFTIAGIIGCGIFAPYFVENWHVPANYQNYAVIIFAFIGGFLCQGLLLLNVFIWPYRVPESFYAWMNKISERNNLFLSFFIGLVTYINFSICMVLWGSPLVLSGFLVYWYFSHFAPHHNLVSTGILGATVLKLVVTFGVPLIKGFVSGTIVHRFLGWIRGEKPPTKISTEVLTHQGDDSIGIDWFSISQKLEAASIFANELAANTREAAIIALTNAANAGELDQEQQELLAHFKKEQLSERTSTIQNKTMPIAFIIVGIIGAFIGYRISGVFIAIVFGIIGTAFGAFVGDMIGIAIAESNELEIGSSLAVTPGTIIGSIYGAHIGSMHGGLLGSIVGGIIGSILGVIVGAIIGAIIGAVIKRSHDILISGKGMVRKK